MSNSIKYIDKRFAVKISCRALIFNLGNPRITILHEKIWFKVSVGDEGLYSLSAVLNFGVLNGPKKNSNPDKTFTTR